MARLRTSSFSTLILLLLTTACAPSFELDHWWADSLTKIFPDDVRGAGRIEDPTFHAARNSSLSLQHALRSRQTLGDLYAASSALAGPGLPIETVRVRWVEYVVVTTNTEDTPDDELLRQAPARFPDALLDQFPITLRKNQTRSLWITVHVPANQAPGEYKGELRLSQGDDVLERIPYKVVVHSATIPARIPLAVSNHFNLSDRHLEQFYGCSRYSDTWWSLIRGIAGFLAGYHQTSIAASPVSFARAEVSGGNLRYDFTNFERYVATFHAAGVDGHIEGGNLLTRERRRDAPVMVTAWVVEDGRAVLRDIPYSDPRAQRFLDTFLPALHQRLQANGWTKKYLQSVLDEPNQWEIEPFVQTAERVRRFLPGVRIMEPVGADQDLGFMEKTTDIWVVQLGTFDDKLDLLQRHVDRGGEIWHYTCLAPTGRYPNRFIDTSLVKVRLLHWINFKHNFRGYLHWGGNYWGPEPFADTQPVINEGTTYLPPGDAFITYPNPLRRSLDSSIRLEQMREGIEDYALLTELAKKDEPKARQISGEALKSFTDYVRDPKQFRAIQRKLLEAQDRD
jgi:hypothetical protein